MFIDKVKIFIKAGDGGNGVVSFLHASGLPNGGPDGGNGGKGGDVVFVISNDVDNLVSFHYSKHFRAGNGENGSKRNRNGKDGKDIYIYVPKGTVIRDAETNKVIEDMFFENKHYVILKGGRGGKGNAFFATSTRQAPKFSQMGEKTKEYAVILELKTIADVGLIGYPNVGKSTLLSCITDARPKIANYHFTTLTPNLGVVKYYEHSFVVADIPGLIRGASEGVGLGHDFLRHIERTRLLVHVVDISSSEGREPYKDFQEINKELKSFSSKLAKLPQIIALNKVDLIANRPDGKKIIDDFKEKVGNKYTVVPISAMAQANVKSLVDEIWKKLKDLPQPKPIKVEYKDFDIKDTTSIKIEKIDNYYEISGGYIEQLIRGIVLSDYQSASYFQKRLRDDGIIKMLKEKGAKNGDTIKIKDIEFELVD